jgi:hypothetical protein
MNDITQHTTDLADLSDAEDVEGHGLKEVAAGFSTAAVLATGAAGVAAISSQPITAGAQAGPVSVSAQADPSAAGSVADVAKHKAVAAVQGAAQALPKVILTLPSHDPVGPRATEAVAGARATALQTTSRTVSAAHTAVVSTVATAEVKAATTLRAVVSDVDTLVGTATDLVGGTRQAVVTVLSDGATAHAGGSSGSVSLRDGSHVLATGVVRDGVATLSWNSSSGGHGTMTLTYSGDGEHTGCSVTL